MSAVEMSCRWRGIVFIDKLGLSFQQSLPKNPVGFALGLWSGVVHLRSVARSCMWWLGMNRDLEELAKSCAACK